MIELDDQINDQTQEQNLYILPPITSKLTYIDDDLPDVVSFNNRDQDKLVKKYLQLYGKVPPFRRVIQRLNYTLRKSDIDMLIHDRY